MVKVFRLGSRPRYPITIVKILKLPGDSVRKQEPLVQYSYMYVKEAGDSVRGETWQEERTSLVPWESPAEGTIKEWKIKEGTVINRDCECLVLEEACSHEIQSWGLCAMCGKDMTEVTWGSDQADTTRATVNMTHDQTSLMISQDLAARTEHDTQRRLLRQEKLSLVVDLDQTIIHACIEPTVGEWQKDSSNPNHNAVKSVQSFQLNEEGGRGPRSAASGFRYYIKMRPGLSDFLTDISKLYELHVYTMGTRAYALNIAKIVDPDQKYFGNRIISRNENGNMVSKSLQRLFPVSTNLVVIIDDRTDVWPGNRHHLIKVTPYDFFKGIGDINSSFLPKRQDILPVSDSSPSSKARPTDSEKEKEKKSEDGNEMERGKERGGGGGDLADASAASAPSAASGSPRSPAFEEVVRMSNGNNRALQEMQTQEQEKTLQKQINDRPLFHLQEQLDREEDEKERASPGPANGDSTSSSQGYHRQQVLRDDDDELFYLRQHLTKLHTNYYETYRKHCSEAGQSLDYGSERSIDVSLAPNVGTVMSRLKGRVLSGTVIVLSGLVPLGVDVLTSDIGFQTQSFGASVHRSVSKQTTHLVIPTSRTKTQKFQQAVKIAKIKIVNQDWLADCLSRWEWLDESPYLIRVHPTDRRRLSGGGRPTSDAAGDGDGETSAKPQLSIMGVDDQRQMLQPDESEESDDETDDDDKLAVDVDHVMPADYVEGEPSPIEDLRGFDWGGADDELNEFLGSDGDDSSDNENENENEQEDDAGDGDDDNDQETESGSSYKPDDDTSNESSSQEDGRPSRARLSTPPSTGMKRKLMTSDDGGWDVGDQIPDPGSALAKKKRIAQTRGASTLRSVDTPPDESSISAPMSSPIRTEPPADNNTNDKAAIIGDNGYATVDIDDYDQDGLEADLIAELENDE